MSYIPQHRVYKRNIPQYTVYKIKISQYSVYKRKIPQMNIHVDINEIMVCFSFFKPFELNNL